VLLRALVDLLLFQHLVKHTSIFKIINLNVKVMNKEMKKVMDSGKELTIIFHAFQLTTTDLM
jgi:hypothetical protein